MTLREGSLRGLCLELVVRTILTTPWPPGVWPSIKDDISRALVLRERLRKAA